MYTNYYFFSLCYNYTTASPVADLRISGYIRNVPLCVNGLVHVTGIGTYRLRRIEECNDPCPRRVQRNNSNASNNGTTNTIEPLAVADMERQDSLGKYIKSERCSAKCSL